VYSLETEVAYTVVVFEAAPLLSWCPHNTRHLLYCVGG